MQHVGLLALAHIAVGPNLKGSTGKDGGTGMPPAETREALEYSTRALVIAKSGGARLAAAAQRP
eukprot:6301158-Prymnesium_polylepis.3